MKKKKPKSAVTQAHCPICNKEWVAVHPYPIQQALECPDCGYQQEREKGD
jgi:transcription elongation factor Elf1